jgi:hypothetical protein
VTSAVVIVKVYVSSRRRWYRRSWTKAKFMTGKYKASDLYPTPWDPQLKKEYEEYLKEKLGKQ